MKIRAHFVCRGADKDSSEDRGSRGSRSKGSNGRNEGSGTGSIEEMLNTDAVWCGFTVSGHDAAGNAGFSVLCAAVSSAVQLTCNTLTECFGVPEDAVQVTPANGSQNQISLRLSSPEPAQSGIVRGLAVHLMLLAEEYPKGLAVTVSQEESPSH